MLDFNLLHLFCSTFLGSQNKNLLLLIKVMIKAQIVSNILMPAYTNIHMRYIRTPTQMAHLRGTHTHGKTHAHTSKCQYGAAGGAAVTWLTKRKRKQKPPRTQMRLRIQNTPPTCRPKTPSPRPASSTLRTLQLHALLCPPIQGHSHFSR